MPTPTPSLYVDLLVINGDLVLNAAGEPQLCDNRVSIGQDIAHALIESGLPYQLIGENSPTRRDDLLMRMVILVEEDRRLVPGTVVVRPEQPGMMTITAQTYDFGVLEDAFSYAK
ncbi:DUF2590 family protein [Edwardsiella tarda]|uniref:DUF2590 family protein n=1 Tax=Edwardsiella tarda TaxID=636 RepID=UPI0024437A57|nr:DUF2590 family protein [Edwardsiella tarda]WGE29413.1 DUF2590 family protein [Edwardsiella tarda]